MEIADDTNKYINEHAPWKLDQADALIIAKLLLTFLKLMCVAFTCNPTSLQTNVINVRYWWPQNRKSWNELVDTKIGDFQPILSRVKPLNIQDFYKKEEEMKEEDSVIQIDDFMKVDLRVARLRRPLMLKVQINSLPLN